jgi:hypothetical protein
MNLNIKIFLLCPIPEDQKPINQYISLKENSFLNLPTFPKSVVKRKIRNFFFQIFFFCTIVKSIFFFENFFSLIQKADSEYIALADQDDIWEPTHLINSVKRIEGFDSVPAMTFTSVSEFEGIPENRLSIWPPKVNLKRPLAFALENLARGCTIVLNKNAIRSINIHKPTYAVMHDWWIGLLISLIGEVRYSQNPEVNYRIHTGNYIGGKPRLNLRLQRFNDSKEINWPPIFQLREIYTIYGSKISLNKLGILEKIVSGLTSPYFVKRVRANLTAHRFRVSLLDDLGIRFLLMTRPFLTESAT